MAASPQREFVESFVTPKVSDTIFWELRSSHLPTNEAPEKYGEEHPEKILFPDHKLVWITPAGGDNEEMQRWYYAKDREEQEEYNWSVTFPFSGLPEFPVFSCEFVLLRSEYTPLAKGTKHPLDLGDDTKNENKRFTDATLVSEELSKIGLSELQSLYVVVRRTYANIPSITQQLTHKVERTFPYAGLKGFPRVTRDLVVPRQDFTPLDKGIPDEIFTKAELISQIQLNIDDKTLESLYVLERRVYDEVPSLVEQETFNAEFSYPYQNAEQYRRVTRIYVVKRSEYDSLVQGTQDNDFPDATLVTQVAVRFKDPALDSLYLKVTRVFDHVPDITDPTDASFLQTIGYQVSRPYGLDDFLRIVWKFPLEKSLFVPANEYSSCPIVGYTNLQLTDETLDDDTEAVDRAMITRVYNKFPGPASSDSEETRPLGIPSKFIRKRTTIQGNQVVKNDAVQGATGGNPTTELATVQASLGPDGRNQVVFNKGDIRVQLDLEKLEGWALDSDSGDVFPFSQEVVASGTGGSDTDENAFFEEVIPIHPDFSILTRRKATGLTDEKTWEEVVNYSWPAVLLGLTFSAAEAKGEFGDYVYKYLHHFDIRDAYAGPCKATVTERWTKEAPPASVPVAMQPVAVEWDLVLTRGSLGPTLHPEFTITETVGNNHPLHPFSVGVVTFKETNYVDWPGSVVASQTLTRYRGGFRFRKIVVDKPEV